MPVCSRCRRQVTGSPASASQPTDTSKPLHPHHAIEKDLMAPPENFTSAEPALPPTAPTLEVPTTGLPEKPSVSDADLRTHAEALSKHWQAIPHPTTNGLTERLVRLQQRLTAILAACRKTTTTSELTPQLELLESTRMLEAPLLHGEETTATFASLPHVRVDGDKELPRVVNLAE